MILQEPFLTHTDATTTFGDGLNIVMHKVAYGELDAKVCDKCKNRVCGTSLGSNSAQYTIAPIEAAYCYLENTHFFEAGETDPAEVVYLTESPTHDELLAGYPLQDNEGAFFFTTLKSLWGADNAVPPILSLNTFRCPNPTNGAPKITTWKKCAQTYLQKILSDVSIVSDTATIIAAGAIAWQALHTISDTPGTAPGILSIHGKPTRLAIGGRDFTVIPVLSGNYVMNNMETQADNYMADFTTVFTALFDGVEVYDAQTMLNDIVKNEILFDEMPSFATLDTLISVMTDKEVSNGLVSFDIETKTANTATTDNYPTLMGFGFGDDLYVQFAHNAFGAVRYIFEKLRESGTILCGQNIKFDLLCCFRFRIFDSVRQLPQWLDTHWLQSLIDENKSAFGKADLKTMMGSYFQWPDYSMYIDNLVKNVYKGNWGLVPMNVLKPYHALDLVGTWMLTNKMLEIIYSDESISGKWSMDYVEFSSQSDKNLLQLSMNGLCIDHMYLSTLTEQHREKMDEIKEFFRKPIYASLIREFSTLTVQMREMVQKGLATVPFKVDDAIDVNEPAFQFNPDSRDHAVALIASLTDNAVKQSMIKFMGKLAWTEGGAFSVSKNNIPIILNYLKDHKGHPAVVEGLEKITEYKKLSKLFGTYIEGMRKFLWPDYCVRAAFRVAGAATGRLSSSGPNIQTIPRTKDIKNMFIPKKQGWLLQQFDLSQAEVRGLANFTGDEELARAYNDGLDMHKFVAAAAFGVKYEDVTKDQRQTAKSLQFGAIYGSSAAGMSNVTGLPVETMQNLLDNYFKKFPKVMPWIQEQHAMVEQFGYVCGALGRKRRLPSYLAKEQGSADLKREGQNACIQGFAGEFTILIINEMVDMLEQYPDYEHLYQLINTVHDSIVFEIHPSMVDFMYQTYQQAVANVNNFFKQIMLNNPSCPLKQWVEMVGDCEVGPRYGQMFPVSIKDEQYMVEMETEGGDKIDVPLSEAIQYMTGDYTICA